MTGRRRLIGASQALAPSLTCMLLSKTCFQTVPHRHVGTYLIPSTARKLSQSRPSVFSGGRRFFVFVFCVFLPYSYLENHEGSCFSPFVDLRGVCKGDLDIDDIGGGKAFVFPSPYLLAGGSKSQIKSRTVTFRGYGIPTCQTHVNMSVLEFESEAHESRNVNTNKSTFHIYTTK